MCHMTGLAFLEDIVELIFLPVLSSADPGLAPALPEVAAALFLILGRQRRWLLTHLLLNKCATALIPISSRLPPQLQEPLTALTQPADPSSIPVHSLTLLQITISSEKRSKKLAWLTLRGHPVNSCAHSKASSNS